MLRPDPSLASQSENCKAPLGRQQRQAWCSDSVSVLLLASTGPCMAAYLAIPGVIGATCIIKLLAEAQKLQNACKAVFRRLRSIVLVTTTFLRPFLRHAAVYRGLSGHLQASWPTHAQDIVLSHSSSLLLPCTELCAFMHSSSIFHVMQSAPW